jgi:hypothetical protein
VQEGAALYSLEGTFGFSAANASAPAPEVGHGVKLINFTGGSGQPLALNLQRFAYNKTFEEAFPDGIRGFNSPTNVRFGPDGCAYVAYYGAVRDLGRSDPVHEPGRCCAGEDPGHRRGLEDLPAIRKMGEDHRGR